MKFGMLLAVAAALLVSSVAMAAPAPFTENFESYAIGTFASTANLINRDALATISVAGDATNKFLSWSADNHLYIAGSATSETYDFDLRVSMSVNGDQWHQRLQIGWNDGTGLQQAGIGLSPTGVAVTGVDKFVGLSGFSVSGLTAYNTWTNLRVQKTGNTVAVKGWLLGTEEPAAWGSTGVAANWAGFGPATDGEAGLRFKWEPGMKVDNISFAVPEPASMSLLAIGGLLALRRRGSK